MKARLKSEAMAAEAEAQRLKTVHEAAAEVASNSIASAIAMVESSAGLADWAYLIVTEQVWKYGVFGFDDLAAAQAHAAKMFTCWVLYEQTAPGTYSEIELGGMSAGMTFGLVHPKIRKWAEARGTKLSSIAVRAPVPALGIVKFAQEAPMGFAKYASKRVSQARASFSQ